MRFYKTILNLIIFICLVIVFCLNPISVLADKPDFPGIWSIWGSSQDTTGKPWYRGHVVTVSWKDIEPTEGQFDWTKLDNKINVAASKGLYVMTLIYTGYNAPDWLYDNGVPRVTGVDHNDNLAYYPYYLNDTYKNYFTRMISEYAYHLNTEFPSEIREKIIGIQAPVGRSGDSAPYYGVDPNDPYNISDSQWITFSKEMFQYYWNQFAQTQPRIQVLFNINNPEVFEWARETFPGFWAKLAEHGDGYQRNREYAPNDPYPSAELSSRASFRWRETREFNNGYSNRTRSEHDNSISKDWFSEAPLWNMYWQQLWNLTMGLDMHNQVKEMINNPDYYPAFDFFAKYAGFKDPRDASGVWVALRDGLDVSDTVRFPEGAEYGYMTNIWTGTDRFNKIAQAMSQFGAKQSVSSANTAKDTWAGLNDVGYNIYSADYRYENQKWVGNYQMWLTQYDPNGTSQGLWRVGSKNQMYGRFARRFDNASGKDNMYFDIDDRFFFNQPLNSQYPVKVRVVYFDQGTGKWSLKYDGQAGNCSQTALTVTKTGSETWKEKIINIPDGYFMNRCPNNTDLVLSSLDNEDDIFHMIEITRETGDRKGCWGDGVNMNCSTNNSACPDLLQVLGAWGNSGGNEDINKDGQVNTQDILLVLIKRGSCL